MRIKLSPTARAVVAGERNRLRMLKTGVTFSGLKIWTEDEIAILIERIGTMPYKEIMAYLPGRSGPSIGTKARKLGLLKAKPHWSDSDIAKLRKLYQRGTLEELERSFPKRSMKAIKSAALSRYFKRPLRPYKPTGKPLVDSVLKRAFQLRLSLLDLDEMCESGRYFRNQTWRTCSGHHGPILRAVEEMSGKIHVTWDNE